MVNNYNKPDEDPLLTVYRLPKEAMDSPLQYSKSRDVHSVGVLFLQMLVGWNVMDIYPSPKLALQSCPFLRLFCFYTPMLTRWIIASLSKLAVHHITNMLNPSRKNGLVCQSVLQDMEPNVRSPRPGSRMSAISIPSGMGLSPGLCTLFDSLVSAPRTPVSRKPFVGSPDDYFAPRFTPQPTSRWREEFEELELLVRIPPPH